MDPQEARKRFLASLEKPAAGAKEEGEEAAPGAQQQEHEEEVVIILDSDEEAEGAGPFFPSAAVASHLAPPKPPPPAPPPSRPAPPPPRPAPPPPRPAPLKPARAPSAPSAPSAAAVPAFNPWGGGYEPPGGFKAGGELRVRESAHLRSVDGSWMAVQALLDTGNEGVTMLSVRAAQRAGLADANGLPVGLGGRRPEMMEVHGVVAGAAERVPLLVIEYRIQGSVIKGRAALTEAGLGTDLLVSRHDILLFQADGFRLSARN